MNQTKQAVEISEEDVKKFKHWLHAYDAALDSDEESIHRVLGSAGIIVELVRNVVRKAE